MTVEETERFVCQEESVERGVMSYTKYEMQRDAVREFGVQEPTLKGLLSTDERAQVRVLIAFFR